MKSIDPRIRRILRTQDEPARLGRDLESGRVQEGVPSTEEDAPAEIMKPVLVELAEDKIPVNFAHFRWDKISDRIYSAEVPLEDIEGLGADPNVVYIEAGRKLGTALDTCCTEIRADSLHNPSNGTTGLDGAGVVVGIVDYGLDYTLDDFRDANGKTRLAFLWDQNLTPLQGERPPAEFDLGVEYDSTAINRALGDANPFSVVRHKPERASHGTHVTGIAVGNGRSHDAQFPAGKFVGIAPGATIIFVQPATGEGGNFTDSVNIARAVSYIYQKAAALRMPCVINMSLGTNGGSHDGESIVERSIDGLLQQRGRAFVKAAGNQHTSLGHASGRLATSETRRLAWHVSSDDGSQNEVEIWYSSRDRFKARVINPAGRATAWVEPGGQIDERDDGSNNAITVESERFTVLNGDALIYIEVNRRGGQPIDAGEWFIELQSLQSLDGQFDAWIERDDDNPSQFVGSDFDPMRTISLPGTVRHGIAVANYDHHVSPPAISPSSGRGRTRDGRPKPEIAAPGTRIMSSCSLGGRPNGAGGVIAMRVAKTGTSMAAPQVTGSIALLLQKSPRLTATQIRGLLIAAARNTGELEHSVAFGFGRLDIERAVQLLGNQNDPGEGETD